MSEELPTSPENTTPEGQNASSHLSKELQKLLSQWPELQEWRDEIITEQVKAGKEKQQKYASLSTQENLSRYFGSLPHSITGWMIRTLSPEDALLHIDANKFLETEQRPNVVVDPFRIGSLGKQHGTFSLKEVKNKDEMVQMITAVREWLLSAQPILSGRIILGTDGRVGRFQEVNKGRQGRESQKNPKLFPTYRAYLAMHGGICGIYNALNSQYYARNHLVEGAKTVAEISPEIVQLISHCLRKTPAQNSMEELKMMVQGLVAEIIEKLRGRLFFHTRKAEIDYLLKLDGGQYDGTRVYWTTKTLQAGLRNRLGKNAGIKEQTMLIEQAKDVELFHWKRFICGAEKGKVDISHVLDEISSDFPAFKERIQNYILPEDSLIFDPFFSFYREWRAFLDQNPEDSLGAQQIITRQYLFITLQEMKSRYAYLDIVPEVDQRLLQGRIAILNQLRERFFPSLPEIMLDFGVEKTILNEALKKEISKIQKLFFLGSPSNSETPPETGTPS